MGQSSVKPEGYLPRIVDEQVERYLRIFGAVEIEGHEMVRQDVDGAAARCVHQLR